MLNQSIKPLGSLHVTDLAREAEVTPATVRYYSRTGLIQPGRDPENGYRCFSGSDLRRVVFIRRAQTLGLTIGDIKSILESVDHGEVPCHQVKCLVEQRLASVKARVAELQATEARISRAISSWEHTSYEAPADGELCPLIERLDILSGKLPVTVRQQERQSNGGSHRVLLNGSALGALA